MADEDIAIMESSEHKNEAWEFISMFLREDIVLTGDIGSFSINERVFEAEAKAEMTPFLERDFSKGVYIRFLEVC